MTVTPKQLENLKKGRGFDKRTTEEVQRIARKGGVNSGESRNLKTEFKAATLKHLLSEVQDPKKRTMLNKAGLPTTYLGLLILNSSAKAGFNGGMFESFFKAAGILDQDSTNINVNNTPIIIGGENELK